MSLREKSHPVAGTLAWLAALLMFFPIFWTVLASFKSELGAIATPPELIFAPTLENYTEILSRADYLSFALNSVVVSFGSTILALLVAVPAAYAMAFYPTKRTRGTLLWMLSTKMLPSVGVLIPIYLYAKAPWPLSELHYLHDMLPPPFSDLFPEEAISLLDTRGLLVIMYMLMNLPIVVWMLFTFFKEMPKAIIEACLIDGASQWQTMTLVLMPLVLPGIASTALLNVILSWNEAFWSLNLTAHDAAPLTAFIASFSAPQGLFWAKLSAASTMAIAPILVFGWFSQRQLVRGLTFGAVK